MADKQLSHIEYTRLIGELLCAVRENRPDDVMRLIAEGAPINGSHPHDWHATSAMHEAALGNNPAVGELLLAKGVPLDERADEYAYRGQTPLHFAARKYNLKMVAWLIEKGARVDIQDRDGYTPLEEGTHHLSTLTSERGTLARTFEEAEARRGKMSGSTRRSPTRAQYG